MKRSLVLFAATALAGSMLASPASAGWFSSDKNKPAPAQQAQPNQQAAVHTLDDDLRQAQLQRVAGNYDVATKMLAQMMLAYPDDSRVVGEYGKALTQKGRSRDGVDFLHRATELSSTDWTVYSALGVAYDQLGDTNSARIAYERALALKPGESVVLNNYGLSRMLAGDLNGAQRMLAQANPGVDPRIQHNVAMLAALQAAHQATAVAAANTRTPGAPRTAVAYVPAAANPLPSNVMMQKVPVDPKAGPVAVARNTTRNATQSPRQLVADNKNKAAAKKKDATPSLRMTADASAP